jgi:flavin-dependent dehydrogenase
MMCNARVQLDSLWDVLVVGAGVAGAMAAWGAARKSRRVLLIDKAAFPRGKACGCCLNAAAVQLLDQAGLNLRRYGAMPIHQFHLACHGAAARLQMPPGLALSREVLDVALIEHAQKAGAVFLPRTIARRTVSAPPCRVVHVLKDGKPLALRAKVVLVADGLGGKLLQECGGVDIARHSRVGLAATVDDAQAAYVAGTIYMACGKGGYAGLVRIERGQLHIAGALAVDAVKRSAGAAEALAEIICQSGLPVPAGLRQCRWHGAPALTRRRKMIAYDRMFVLGDAAGYVEPFSGEGMAWALAAGRSVIPLARQAVDQWHPGLARQWHKQQHQLLHSRQRACGALAMTLRHPRMVSFMVQALRVAPALAGPLVRHINRPFMDLYSRRSDGLAY